jgi:HEAT repeat protein
MHVRLAAVVLCCIASTLAQEPQKPKAEPELSPREVARRAAREIDRVAKEREVDELLELLAEKGLIDDTDVVRAVGDLVGDERERVRWAAVVTLRYNPNEKAGSELIAAAKKPDVKASEPLFAEVLRGIGQHGDVRALELLAEGFGPKKDSVPVTEARIDAVGRLRTAEAVDTLIKYARSGFAKGREQRICTALQGLTGESLGSETKPWVLWWNRAKLGYRFPEDPPSPPRAWSSIWETPAPERMFDRIPGSGREAAGAGEGERGQGEGGGRRRGPGRGEGRNPGGRGG